MGIRLRHAFHIVVGQTKASCSIMQEMELCVLCPPKMMLLCDQ